MGLENFQQPIDAELDFLATSEEFYNIVEVYTIEDPVVSCGSRV